jgi:hypothetical protein
VAHEAEVFESGEPGGFRVIEGTVIRPRPCPVEGCPNSVSYRLTDDKGSCVRGVILDATCSTHAPKITGWSYT